VVTELEAVILERRQNKVVFGGGGMQDVEMEREMEQEVLERRQSTVVANSTASAKERRLSVEMHGAIDAVEQEEDDGEGKLHD
jgi:hypothetical protein